jgi:hypothetical protein
VTQDTRYLLDGCYTVSEVDFRWVQIECVEDVIFLYDKAPIVLNLLTYFT